MHFKRCAKEKMKLRFNNLTVCFLILANLDSPVFSMATLPLGSFDIRVTDILLFALWFPALLMLMLRLKRSNTALKYSSISRKIMVLLFWVLVSAFIVAPCYGTPIVNGSLPHLRNFAFWTLFYLPFIVFRNQQQTESFIISFLVILIVTSARIVFDYFYLYFKSPYLLIETSDLRAGESFHQLAFLLCLSLTRFTTEVSLRRLLYVGSILSILSIIITGSRGVMLTTLVAVILYFYTIGSLRQKMLGHLSILTCFLIVFILLEGSLGGRFENRYQKGIDDIRFLESIFNSGGSFQDYLSTKTYIGDLSLIRKGVEYEAIFEEIKKSPIWGLGVGHEYEKLWMRGEETYKNSSYVHSVYNYFLMDSGLIGLLLFLGLIYNIARRFLVNFKQAEVPFQKGVALGCFLSTISLAINSFNGSFLLSIPNVAFLATFSGINELLIMRANLKTSQLPYSYPVAQTAYEKQHR